MENITDIITGAFRGNTLERLSSQLDASPAALERGIAQAVPLSVAGFAEQTRSDQSAGDLFARIRDGSYPRLSPSDLGQVASDPAATKQTVQSSNGFLSGFFGNKLNSLIDMVSGASGVNRSSAGTLLGLIAPMLLGWLGHNVKSKGLNAQGLSRLLADESQKVSGRLPAGFSAMFTGGPGAAHEARDVGHTREREYRAHDAGSHVSQRPGAEMRRDAHPERRRPRRLPWLLVALAAIAAIVSWWAFRRDERARTPEAEAPRVAEAPRERERPPERAQAPAGERPEQTRPEGARPEPTGPEGTEVQRVAGTDVPVLRDDARSLQVYFQDQQRPAPQRFLLEGLVFGTNEAAVVSNAMLDETARILTANPNAQGRIEGYTDQQGSDQENQMLSQRRADAVRDYLIRRGVPENQLTATGMSSSNQLASDDTPQGRSQNRRVELIITQR